MQHDPNSFEILAFEFNTEVLQSFMKLLNSFEPGNNGAFSIILQSCHKVDLTPKALSDMADVSSNTIKRWTETGKAGKYYQKGLVEDIKEFVTGKLAEIN